MKRSVDRGKKSHIPQLDPHGHDAEGSFGTNHPPFPFQTSWFATAAPHTDRAYKGFRPLFLCPIVSNLCPLNGINHLPQIFSFKRKPKSKVSLTTHSH